MKKYRPYRKMTELQLRNFLRSIKGELNGIIIDLSFIDRSLLPKREVKSLEKFLLSLEIDIAIIEGLLRT